MKLHPLFFGVILAHGGRIDLFDEVGHEYDIRKEIVVDHAAVRFHIVAFFDLLQHFPAHRTALKALHDDRVVIIAEVLSPTTFKQVAGGSINHPIVAIIANALGGKP